MAQSTAPEQASAPRPRSLWLGRIAACLPTSAAIWSVLVFTIGTVVVAGLQRHIDPFQGTQRLVELDLGEAFASAAILSLLFAEPRAPSGLSRLDLGVLVLCSLCWTLPESHAVYLGMTLVGL
ncbi:hypothetical protein [Methylobacterium komagatae]